MEKNQVRKERIINARMEKLVLNHVVTEGTFKQRPKREGVSHAYA